MPRTARLWLGLTVLAAALLSVVAWWHGDKQAITWMAASVGVSLVTSVTSRLAVIALGAGDLAFARLAMESFVRLGLPLSVLFAIAATGIETIDRPFLFYFLPFQFITLISDTIGSVWRLNAENQEPSAK